MVSEFNKFFSVENFANRNFLESFEGHPYKVKVDSPFYFTDSFEMLKALYDFQAVYPKTISFFEGEHFILHQTSVKQRNWWQVINMKGSIGFVPSNYVNKIKVS